MGLTTGLCQHNMIVVVIGVILGPGVSWGFQSTETCDQKHLHFHWVKIVLGQNRIGPGWVAPAGSSNTQVAI